MAKLQPSTGDEKEIVNVDTNISEGKPEKRMLKISILTIYLVVIINFPWDSIIAPLSFIIIFSPFLCKMVAKWKIKF